LAASLKRAALATVAALVLGAGAYVALAPESLPGMDFVPGGPAVLGYVYYTGLFGPRPYDVAPFWIDRFEETNAQYRDFVAATGHAPAAFDDDPALNQDDQPVTGVLHQDALDYCKWAGKRLPTEVEWEKAARGTDGRLYPWGNDKDLSRAVISGAAPVSVTASPGDISPYGVRDMAGNVSEWVADTRTARAGRCLDGNGPDYSRLTPEMRGILEELKAANGGKLPALCSSPAAADPTVPSEPCAYIKGNNWDGRPHMTVASNRLWDYTNSYAEFVGFRCAQDAR